MNSKVNLTKCVRCRVLWRLRRLKRKTRHRDFRQSWTSASRSREISSSCPRPFR